MDHTPGACVGAQHPTIEDTAGMRGWSRYTLQDTVSNRYHKHQPLGLAIEDGAVDQTPPCVAASAGAEVAFRSRLCRSRRTSTC